MGRSSRSWRAGIVVFGMIGLMGCSPHSTEFLITQLCLQNDQGVSEFIKVMREIANRNEMQFIDRSPEAREELRNVDNSRITGPVVQLTLRNDNGTAATATNLGLTPHEVAIGFGERDNPAEAQKFAQEVFDALSRRWTVYRVTKGQNALPLKNCPRVDQK